MKASWQIEADGLVCRWSNPQENTPLTQDASPKVQESFVQKLPGFAAHSPLGSGEWIAPWSARWSVPRPTSVER